MLFNKTCLYCKTNFTTKYELKIYCCEKCRNGNYKKNLWKKIKIEKTKESKCQICNKKIESSNSRIIYCSEECKNIANKEKEKAWQENNKEQYLEKKKNYMQKVSTKIKKQKDYLEINTTTKEESIQNGVYKTPYALHEDKFILENWNKLTKKEIALALSRTYAAIYSRYNKIN